MIVCRFTLVLAKELAKAGREIRFHVTSNALGSSRIEGQSQVSWSSGSFSWSMRLTMAIRSVCAVV